MLGAIITLLLIAAAAYAVTQVGGVITLLFIAAVLVLAYRRLSLLTFTATFTVLLIAYTVLGESSVAGPIFDHAGHAVGAIGVVDATERLFAYSTQQNCRFYNILRDDTARESKDRYKQLRALVEGHFYVSIRNSAIAP